MFAIVGAYEFGTYKVVFADTKDQAEKEQYRIFCNAIQVMRPDIYRNFCDINRINIKRECQKDLFNTLIRHGLLDQFKTHLQSCVKIEDGRLWLCTASGFAEVTYWEEEK